MFTEDCPFGVCGLLTYYVGVRLMRYEISDVNAPTESLEDAVIACIKADQPVFFG